MTPRGWQVAIGLAVLAGLVVGLTIGFFLGINAVPGGRL